MRIETIQLVNYRQFRDSKISFQKGSGDLHLFVGKNGTGKTNILNAINWCLYEEEPHLSKTSQQLSPVNLKAIEEAAVGDLIGVEVSITTAVDRAEYITFTRRAHYRILQGDGKKDPVLQGPSELTVMVCDNRAKNTEILRGEDAESCVGRFIPKSIREYYLFDGERLDKYFQESAANVRNAVDLISQIEVLKRTEEHLSDLLKESQREARKLSPEIERKEDEASAAQRALDDLDERMAACRKQIRDARDGIQECNDALGEAPNLEELEQRRANLKGLEKQKTDALTDKIQERRDMLVEFGRLLPLVPCMRDALSLIHKKQDRREIPPPADPVLLEAILKDGKCQVCGRELDNDSRAEVDSLLKSIQLTSGIGKVLWDLNPQLVSSLEKAKGFGALAERLAKDIRGIEDDLDRIRMEINTIDAKVIGWPADAIKARYQQRMTWEKVLAEELTKLGMLTEERKALVAARDKARKAWEDELKKVTKATELFKQIDLLTEALEVVAVTKSEIMEGTRDKIEQETNRLFMGLIWKKNTFDSVKIDSEYSLSLIHRMGYDCLGTISAAERELLALAFTLALHRVSGFDSPILIDTPVARISDVPRGNFARVLADLGATKQVVLLFIPDEYTKDVEMVLEPVRDSKHMLLMSTDESVTIAEVVQ